MNVSSKIYPWQFIYDEAGIEAITPKELPFSLHVARHANEDPHRSALCFLNQKISYSELNAQAAQLANKLTALGVTKKDVIGIQMPNIPQYIVTLLAVSKIGGIVSNVSPLLAAPELVYQIKDANISTLVSLDAFIPLLKGVSEQVQGVLKQVIFTNETDFFECAEVPQMPKIAGIDAYHYATAISNEDTTFEQALVSLDDVALLQYTGGTTGKPKGAMLTFGNLAWVAENTYIHARMVAGEDVVASPFPLFHIAGIAGIMAGLRAGCMSLLIPDPRDIDHIIDLMIQNPPTHLGGVPALYQLLLNHRRANEVDFSRLKIAITGAAPLSGGDRKKIVAWLGENKLSDVFGMTETSPTYVSNPPNRAKPTTLGIPLPGVDVKIVDLETGTVELPLGKEGEIIANTPGMMKGYLNLQSETDRALRQIDGKQYMYTGDVGYMDSEGYITICDRAKDMLIVGGYKVFSIEVEDKLSEIDFIDVSAVIGTPDEKRPGNEIVNLFVQLSPDYTDKGKSFLETEIIDFCRKNMSPYKVPKHVVFLEKLPVTAVGKIDKKALREKVYS